MKQYLPLLLILLLISCKNRQTEALGYQTQTDSSDSISLKPRIESNAIYYWKTIYDLGESELAFLKEHDVNRIYIRYFDVALDNNWLAEELSAIPIATINFKQIPSETMEVVPTVYITLEALHNMRGNEVLFADKIITRVMAMTKRHNIPNVNEMQFDCDWTATTRESFFKLCDIARDSLHHKGVALSATIRLHQLKESPPPVDRGVLMLYNTGSLRDAETQNSILNYADVEPYLKKASYNLPLDFAYPTFAWGVWFREGKFKAIIRKTDFSNNALYQAQSNGTYKVTKDHYLESHELHRGDIIRLENSRYDEIMKVKCLVESKLKQDKYSVILYHLDVVNLSKYTHNEIEDIYFCR